LEKAFYDSKSNRTNLTGIDRMNRIERNDECGMMNDE
jgi:hypothetical protein